MDHQLAGSVKSEQMTSPGKRPICMIDVDALVNKCVKRRRRDSSTAVSPTGHSVEQQQQKQTNHQSSTTTTTTTTTVKRSSRFRGVSRFDILFSCSHFFCFLR